MWCKADLKKTVESPKTSGAKNSSFPDIHIRAFLNDLKNQLDPDHCWQLACNIIHY